MTDKAIEALHQAIRSRYGGWAENTKDTMTIIECLAAAGFTITPIVTSDEKMREAWEQVKNMLSAPPAMGLFDSGLATIEAALAELERVKGLLEERHFTDSQVQDKDAKIAELCSTIDAQLAELERLRKGSQWQPIETAPRDGKRVLAYCAPYGAGSAHFSDKWHLDFCVNREAAPTHWMPLPPPPATEGK